jgi:hypothetical protein
LSQDFSSPLSSVAEDWWLELQTSWVKYIKPCLSMFLEMNSPAPGHTKANATLGKYIESLIRDRDPEVTYWLKKAFFAAPNDPELFGTIRGWDKFMNIIGSTYIVYNDRKSQMEEYRKALDENINSKIESN